MKNIFHIFVAVTTIVSTVVGQDCSPEELMQCARPLRVLTENSEFGFVVNKEELDRQCPDLNEGIRCIDSYTRRCFNARKRQHFNKLYAGTTKVIQELCQEGAYQEEFLKHAPCMRQVRSDHEDCAHNYQQRIEELNALTSQAQGEEAQPEHVLAEKQVQTVCCSFQAYLRCSEKVVQRACGEETAKFTESFLDRMSSSLIQNHCDQYPTGSEKCAEYFSGAQLSLPSWTLHLCVAIFLFLYSRT